MIEEKKLFKFIILGLILLFAIGIFFSIKFLKSEINTATNPSSAAKITTQDSLNSGYSKILHRFQ